MTDPSSPPGSTRWADVRCEVDGRVTIEGIPYVPASQLDREKTCFYCGGSAIVESSGPHCHAASSPDGRRWTAGEVAQTLDSLWGQLEEATRALEWLLTNSERISDGKPVRNWDEVLAAARACLAQLRGEGEA